MRTLFTLVLLSVGAQNFAPVGATWHYTQVSAYGPEISYTYFESLKDTVYHGVECRKLGGNGSGCAWQAEYVYDSNDSVFFWHPDREEFCLLYNFGADVGDSWTVHHISSDYGAGQLDSTVLMVDSIDIEIIAGISLRVLLISQVNPFQDHWSFGGKIVERIGNMFYLFPYYGACDPVPGDIRCYSDSVINFSQGPYDCDEVISSVGEVDRGGLNVYPNPATEFIRLQATVPAFQIAEVRISDMLGRNMTPSVFDHSPFAGGEPLRIDVSPLPNGIYILQATDAQGRSFSIKFVKQ